MRIVVSILAVLFGLLHIIAAITQFQSKDPTARGSAIMMALGGMAVIAAAISHLAGVGGAVFGWVAALELLVGCGLVCFSAYLNGKRSEDFHLPHHVTRGGIAALMVICFTIW